MTLGNGRTFKGWSVSPGSYNDGEVIENLALVYNKTISPCDDSLITSSGTYHSDSSIIICDYNTTRVTYHQIFNVIQSNLTSIFAFDYPIFDVGVPGVVISSKEALEVMNYTRTDSKPVASIRFKRTITGTRPTPIVSLNSAREPSPSSSSGYLEA